MARSVSFAGKPWYVIGTHIEGNYSYLRAVNPVKISNDSDTNWKNSSVRKYLNDNFFKTLSGEMRKRIIMVLTALPVRLESTQLSGTKQRYPQEKWLQKQRG